MARNRKRAKERQARRKAQGEGAAGENSRPGGGVAGGKRGPGGGLADENARPGDGVEGENSRAADAERTQRAPDQPRAEDSPDAQQSEPDAGDGPPENEGPPLDAHLRAGAPPEDVGRSDEVLEYEQDLDAEDGDEHFDSAEDFPEEDLGPGQRGRRESAEEHKKRPRFVQFLVAVWAELQRVQWPDRQALTTLTGVVLGFVLLAGGYLGLLDAIFSRIIQAIL